MMTAMNEIDDAIRALKLARSELNSVGYGPLAKDQVLVWSILARLEDVIEYCYLANMQLSEKYLVDTKGEHNTK